MKKVSIVLVAIGGYGGIYVNKLLFNDRNDIKVVGIVDPMAEKAAVWPKIKSLGIPVYDDIEEFYNEKSADLAIISSPIQYHCPQTIRALQAGSHVLCEKPVASTINDVKEMIAARDENDGWVGVGYQRSWFSSVIAFKKDIIAGKYGRLKRAKAVIEWPRNHAYYNRNNWAGRIMDAEGNLILDSVAHNATAHYLHHLLNISGTTMETTAELDAMEVEIYKINPIETFDSCFMRVRTIEGVELLYLTSHAVVENKNPRFEYQFENATAYLDENTLEGIIVKTNDGEIINYGVLDNVDMDKLESAIKSVHTNDKPSCSIEAASRLTECMNAIYKMLPAAPRYPVDVRRFDDIMNVNYVENLNNDMDKCFDEWKLPCELGIEWSLGKSFINMKNWMD